jgi:hypothetical protein
MISLLVLAGCSGRPDESASRRDSGAQSSPGEGIRVLGRCCPDTDTGITALVQRYESTPDRDRPPEVALWAYWMTSGMSDRERLVIHDSTSWARLWPRIVGSHSPRPPVPAVDFATEMLLVVSMGTRSSGGYITVIDSIAIAGDTVRVAVREQSPGPRCGTPAVLSAPVALARIERTEKPVTFTTREVIRDCE